jgi:hypothetical protein
MDNPKGYTLSFASTQGEPELNFTLTDEGDGACLAVGIGKQRISLDEEDTESLIAWIGALLARSAKARNDQGQASEVSTEAYPFRISIWLPGRAGSLLDDRGHCMEYARCTTKARAEETALCLILRYQAGIQVSELAQAYDLKAQGMVKRFVGYKFYPPEASRL